MKTILVVLILIFVNTAEAQDGRWHYFSEDDSTLWYYDNDRIAIGEDFIIVWWKVIFPKDKDISYALYKITYYCLYQSYIIDKIISYNYDGSFEENKYPDGKVLQEIIPETFAELSYNYFYKMWRYTIEK